MAHSIILSQLFMTLRLMVDHTLSTTCHCLPGFYTDIKLHCLESKAVSENALPMVVM